MIKLGVVAGDGVGPEVIAESLQVLAAVARSERIAYELTPIDIGGERYLKTGEILPDDAVRQLRASDAILLGAVGHPKVAARSAGERDPPSPEVRLPSVC